MINASNMKTIFYTKKRNLVNSSVVLSRSYAFCT